MDVYGYVNGNPVYSRDEFIYKSRGFEEITNDAELLDYAKKVTSNWYNAGHNRSFVTFYLSDFVGSSPKKDLTDKEFKRLVELQNIAKDEYEREMAKYNMHKYEGTPLTEEQVKMFLDKKVEDTKQKWGENSYYTNSAEQLRSEYLSRFRKGEVVPVFSEEYTDAYGNGTGSFANTLMSDGTIQKCCFGYLD